MLLDFVLILQQTRHIYLTKGKVSHILYLPFIERVSVLNKVKEQRVKLRLTQIELARKVGVARQTINLIENNKYNPSLSLCISLAKELKTDLNSLFWEE